MPNLLELIRELKGDPEVDLPAIRKSLSEARLDGLRAKSSPQRIRLYERYLHSMLQRLADEQASFFTTFNRDRGSVSRALRIVYDHLTAQDAPDVGEGDHVEELDVTARGCLGFLLFAMDTISVAQEPESSHQTSDPLILKQEREERLTKLISDPPVREIFGALYDPGREAETGARQFWEELRCGNVKVKFFRDGTTSFLLLCDAPARRSLVLKCLHFAFQSVSVIQRDTKSYSNYILEIREAIEELEPENNLVVEVDYSTSKWILMEHIEGPTLREELDRLNELRRACVDSQSEDAARQVIEWVKFYAFPVIDGIELLHRVEIPHLDLSPSNIILVPSSAGDSPFQVRLIDLGRNYLASESIGIVRSRERRYVAPEVRGLGPADSASFTQEADLYSYGCLLSELCAGKLPDEAGTVPDEVYSAAPIIGRLTQDLLDREPSNRLLLARASLEKESEGVTSSRFARWVRLRLKEAILHMQELVSAGQAGKERQLVPYVYVWPAIDQVFRLVRHLRKTLGAGKTHQANPRSADPMKREMRASPAWSLVCLTFFALSILLIVGLFFETLFECGSYELFDSRIFRFIFQFIPSFDLVPDGLSPAYACKDMLRENQDLREALLYQVQIVSFTSAFAVLGYYQGIFARLLIPRGISDKTWLERAARVSMRGTAVIPFILILAGNLFWYRHLLWIAAAGNYYPAINNNLSHRLRLRYLDEAEKPPPLKPIPERDQYKNDLLAGWCLGMPFFATVLLVGAISNQIEGFGSGTMWAFAALLAAWNIYIFFSRVGPRRCTEVRGSLSLAFTLGERASCRRIIRKRQRSEDPESSVSISL